MSNRTEVGYQRTSVLRAILTAATALGATDTAIILFPTVAQQASDGSNGYVVTSTAAAGSQIAITRPGIYSAQLCIGLGTAGVLSGGISVGSVLAPFTDAPDGFGTAAANWVAIQGDPTLATTEPLVNVKATFPITRANITAGLNIVRFGATVGVTLAAANSRAEIMRVGLLNEAA